MADPTEDPFSDPFGLLGLVVAIASSTATWLLLAFTFGALYPRLPGTVGALKAVSLGALYAASAWAPALLPGGTSGPESPIVFGLEIFVFAMVLGVLYDWRTTRSDGADWRHVVDLYQLRRVRFAVGYLAPIALAIVVLIAQVATGNVEQGASQFVQGAPALVAPAGIASAR